MVRRKDKCREECREKETLCGAWSSLAPMILPRENFAGNSGPDQNATGTAQGINGDPRVYAMGGITGLGGMQGFTDQCEKYNPNTDTWSQIAPLPVPLGNCSGSFVPDYGITTAINLGYIYVAGGNIGTLFRYDIKQDFWEEFPVPFAVSNASLQYLDDVGGPLAQLLILTTGAEFPACTDGQTLWVVGGDGTEQQTWFVQLDINGRLVGEWARGPDLPLLRTQPLVGRVFWRDAGITSFGVSNCASIAICGGFDENGIATRDVQLLVRKNCQWQWIHRGDNDTDIPNDVLTLATPVANGAFGTEQWPETLITGGRALLFGGVPPVDSSGSTQFAQLRFVDCKYRRDPCLAREKSAKDSAWNFATPMPGNRTNFEAAPLSQANSALFGGRRVSRFVCIGGRDNLGLITNRNQLFQLPTPSPFVLLEENKACRKKCKKDKRDKCKKHKKHREDKRKDDKCDKRKRGKDDWKSSDSDSNSDSSDSDNDYKWWVEWGEFLGHH